MDEVLNKYTLAMMNPNEPRFMFNTVGIFTSDNGRTVNFYTKVFGFQTDWDGNLIEIGSFTPMDSDFVACHASDHRETQTMVE